MNKIRLLPAICASVLTFSLSSSAVAAVTYKFSGIITESWEKGSGFDPEYNYDRVFDGIEIDDVFTGVFIYEPSDGWETWLIINEAYSASGTSWSLDGHGDASDIHHLLYTSSYAEDRWYTSIAIEFGSYTDMDDYYGTDSLPNALPEDLLHSLITFNYNGAGYAADYEYSFALSGQVTSISAVPIPPAVWLFGSGLIGLVGLARRKA